MQVTSSTGGSAARPAPLRAPLGNVFSDVLTARPRLGSAPAPAVTTQGGSPRRLLVTPCACAVRSYSFCCGAALVYKFCHVRNYAKLPGARPLWILTASIDLRARVPAASMVDMLPALRLSAKSSPRRGTVSAQSDFYGTPMSQSPNMTCAEWTSSPLPAIAAPAPDEVSLFSAMSPL